MGHPWPQSWVSQHWMLMSQHWLVNAPICFEVDGHDTTNGCRDIRVVTLIHWPEMMYCTLNKPISLSLGPDWPNGSSKYLKTHKTTYFIEIGHRMLKWKTKRIIIKLLKNNLIKCQKEPNLPQRIKVDQCTLVSR